METKIKNYIEELQQSINERFKRLNYPFAPDVYTYTETPKYYKIWCGRNNRQDYIFAFVDKTTGDIYKPAGTKAPAKGARGNLDGFKPMNMSELYKRR